MSESTQSTPEAVDDVVLLTVDEPYPALAPGKLRNINGSGGNDLLTITAHGDVTKPEIVAAFLRHVAQP